MRVKKMVAVAGLLALGVSSASAADLAVKAPRYVAPVADWTGLYAGVNVGAGWGTTETTVNSITAVGGGGGIGGFGGLPLDQNSRSGILGGGQIGYNYQAGWLVFGVQGDIAATDIKGTTPCLVAFTCSGKSDWLASATARFGGLVGTQTLVYAKGGAAWLHSTHSFGVSGLGGGGGVGLGSSSLEETSLGWTLGMGGEYAFTPNWSAFFEYDYSEFKKDNAAFPLGALGGGGGGVVTANDTFQNKLSVAKIGVNYKFGH